MKAGRLQFTRPDHPTIHTLGDLQGLLGPNAHFLVRWRRSCLRPKLDVKALSLARLPQGRLESIDEDGEVHSGPIVEPQGALSTRNDWSRETVKLDCLHFLMRITDLVKKSHGLRNIFCCRFRDAVFALHQGDRREFEEKLGSKLRNQGFSEKAIKQKLSEEWPGLIRQSRRSIPDPVALEKAVTDVVEEFGYVPDDKTGEPLFSQATWDAVEEALEHIRRGCLSDHPRFNLYYTNPNDKTRELFNMRGTSPLEGLHLYLRMTLTGNNVSPDLAQKIILNKICRWNADRGIDHRGEPDFGTHETDVLDRLKYLDERLKIEVCVRVFGFSNHVPRPLASICSPFGLGVLICLRVRVHDCCSSDVPDCVRAHACVGACVLPVLYLLHALTRSVCAEEQVHGRYKCKRISGHAGKVWCHSRSCPAGGAEVQSS